MDIQRAADILEIELIKIVDLKYITKKYHKLALQYHPDKNENKTESNEKFQQINEAYYYLKEINEKHGTTSMPDINTNTFENDTTYINMLQLFIRNIFQYSSSVKWDNSIFTIINEIVVSCKQISFQLFGDLDKYTSFEIYEFISKYKTILHISPETIESVKQIVLEKFKDDQLYILNPSLDDLFDNNVYKLTLCEKPYFIPLWHNELYFDADTNNSEIIIKCVPILPDNVNIDENNNLLVHHHLQLTKELLNTNISQIQLGKRTFDIQVNTICIKKTQTITFKRQGISKINENDMYNIDNKSDIIVYLILE
jgi:hypothetical protein